MARRTRLTHERRVLLLSFLGGLPGVAVALGLLLGGNYSPAATWTLGILIVAAWAGFAFALQGAVVRPLQTLSNLLSALREEDFSFKARGIRGDDALAHAMLEVNALADTLREQRLGALEATALLKKVMAEVDVAVFTFDADACLRLVNRAGESLLGKPSERLLGRTAHATRAEPGALGRDARRPRDGLPRGDGALGGAARDLPRGGPAPPASRSRGHDPGAARGGAPGLAAAHPGSRPRAEQLPGSDPLDRGEPADPARPEAAPCGLGGGRRARDRGHPRPLRGPRALHRGVLAAGSAARHRRWHRWTWAHWPVAWPGSRPGSASR